MAPRAIVFAMANPNPEVDPEAIEGLARGDRDRPQRLPEPDQQRPRLPRRLPRRTRRAREQINAEMEVAAARAIADADRRRRARSGLRDPERLQPRRRAGGRRRRRRSGRSGARKSASNRSASVVPADAGASGMVEHTPRWRRLRAAPPRERFTSRPDVAASCADDAEARDLRLRAHRDAAPVGGRLRPRPRRRRAARPRPADRRRDRGHAAREHRGERPMRRPRASWRSTASRTSPSPTRRAAGRSASSRRSTSLACGLPRASRPRGLRAPLRSCG